MRDPAHHRTPIFRHTTASPTITLEDVTIEWGVSLGEGEGENRFKHAVFVNFRRRSRAIRSNNAI